LWLIPMYYLEMYAEVLRKSREPSVTIVLVLARIRIGHFANTSQKGNLLGLCKQIRLLINPEFWRQTVFMCYMLFSKVNSDCFLKQVKVKVKITLRLAVYRQSVRLGAKRLETHDQRFFLRN
jgi:hypothetical protein